MLYNFIKTALRNFFRNLGYTTINVIGLALGLMTSIFIFLWVFDELSYDTFHHDRDRLYQVMHNFRYSDGSIETFNSTSAPLTEQVWLELPDVQYMVRTDWGNEVLFEYNKKSMMVRGYSADKDFFKTFNFPIVHGDANNPIANKNSVAISRKTAENFFGKENPIGKSFRIAEKYDMTVSAVFENVPANSTFNFDFISPFEVYHQERPWLNQWGNSSIQSFVLLKEGADRESVEKKMMDITRKHCEDCIQEPFLHPFDALRLNSRFVDGKAAGGRIEYVRTFIIIAIFILTIACINFMNLSTARSATRGKEVGVRKVIGADRKSLVLQFIGEAMIISFLSLAVAIATVETLMPLFNTVTGKNITFRLGDPTVMLSLAGIAIIAGLLAGSYPAFFLSSFRPANVLKSGIGSSFTGGGLRKVLVVFQFSLSIILIVGSIVVYNQISFIRSKNLGFDRKNVISLPIYKGLESNIDGYKQQALSHPGVLSISVSGHNPFDVQNSTTDPIWPGKPENNVVPFKVIIADENFLPTLGIELLDGRNFRAGSKADTINYIVNESAAEVMGLKKPVGTPLEMWYGKGEIIGLVKNFHNGDFREHIEPLIISFYPSNTWRVFVKLEGKATESALRHLEGLHKKFDPAYPFEYSFLDSDFDNQYKMEITTGKISVFFTVMAIIISCLGLLGLASFTAERRTKEFGVRKVLGASVANLVFLLCKDFTKLVLIAIVLSFPLAYYFASTFLEQYVFHTDLSLWIFFLTGLAILSLALITVTIQSAKVAMRNPVNSLRAE